MEKYVNIYSWTGSDCNSFQSCCAGIKMKDAVLIVYLFVLLSCFTFDPVGGEACGGRCTPFKCNEGTEFEYDFGCPRGLRCCREVQVNNSIPIKKSTASTKPTAVKRSTLVKKPSRYESRVAQCGGRCTSYKCNEGTEFSKGFTGCPRGLSCCAKVQVKKPTSDGRPRSYRRHN